MSRVLQGSIVRAQVTDPQGGNPKQRPLVVVTTSSEIDLDGELVAVAITGELATPLSDDEVLLQWHPLGRCRTRLKKPSVAKCSWLKNDFVVGRDGGSWPRPARRTGSNLGEGWSALAGRPDYDSAFPS